MACVVNGLGFLNGNKSDFPINPARALRRWTMKILLVILAILSYAPGVYAQHPIWLDEAIRVDDPAKLPYWMAVEPDCPLTEQAVGALIEGVISRNRIRPLRPESLEAGQIYLNVSLRCTKAVSGGNHAFSININFARYKPWPAILFDVPYAAVGFGEKDALMQSCEAHLEDAVAAFRKANLHFFGQR